MPSPSLKHLHCAKALIIIIPYSWNDITYDLSISLNYLEQQIGLQIQIYEELLQGEGVAESLFHGLPDAWKISFSQKSEK